jgi:predicted nucleic acid-binding protein
VLVVADSSPLIYLSRAGAIHVLPALFDEVVVPRTVWDEAVERRPSAPGISALHQASWLRVVDDPSVELDLGLDPGETAAIALVLDALLSEGFRIAPALIREALAHVGEGSE